MRFRTVFIILSIAVTLLSGLPAYGDEGEKSSSRVVLLPFVAQNAGTYSVLKDGLRNMLSSRLASKEGIVLLENTLSIEEQSRFRSSTTSDKRSFYQKLETNFIGVGELLTQKSELILRVDFYREDGKRPVSVTMLAKNEKEILDGVDILSQRIAVKVFGFEPVQKSDKGVNTGQVGIEAFRTDHPDKKYKEEIVSGSSLLGDESRSLIQKENLMRRSSALPEGVVSLAVGDGDGDGIDEVFIASENDLHIFHYEGGVLKLLADFSIKPSLKIHRIGVADMDGDGRVEIYLSAMEQSRFSSTILTWGSETGFQQKLKNIRWAIRPLLLPEKGLVLVGQAREAADDKFWQQDIYSLKIDAESKKISPVTKLFLPEGISLFDFVKADIDGDGRIETIAITNKMKMAVYDHNNSLIWLSEKDFGGGLTYLGKRWSGREGSSAGSNFSGDDENVMDLHFLPTRLLTMDVDNDGKAEIITGKNTLSTTRYLPNMRSFNGGIVASMGWDGEQMVELWATGQLDGYIPSYDILSRYSEMDGDKEDGQFNRVKLYIGQIPSDSFSSFFSNRGGEANIVIYEFNIMDKSKLSVVDK